MNYLKCKLYAKIKWSFSRFLFFKSVHFFDIETIFVTFVKCNNNNQGSGVGLMHRLLFTFNFHPVFCILCPV